MYAYVKDSYLSSVFLRHMSTSVFTYAIANLNNVTYIRSSGFYNLAVRSVRDSDPSASLT
jgi:hypothetical protein